MRRGGLLGLCVLGLGVVLAGWWARNTEQRPPAAQPPATAPVAVRPPEAAPSEARPQTDVPAGRGLASARFPARSSRLVRAALDRQIAVAGLDDKIGRAERREMVTALARVRLSARRLQYRRRPDPRVEAEHTQLVLAADRLFREKLGIGVAAFIAAQGPAGRIEDLSTGQQ